MDDKNIFFLKLIGRIADSINNEYFDNYSVARFGKEKNKQNIIQKIAKIFGYIKADNSHAILKTIIQSDLLITSSEYLFYHLSDNYSKELLIKVLVYRLLGYKKVKLPMNDGNYFKSIDEIEKCVINKKDYIDTDFKKWKLLLFDLNKFGFPCKLYFTPAGIYHQFIYKSYEYDLEKEIIKVNEGDYVIDAGACWGDTALYFAILSGVNGRVFSFEFLPENVNIFKKNISLNPDLKDRIELIQKPIWSISDVDVFCNSNGPGNTVTFDKKYSDTVYKTITIDDFVIKNDIKKINFIKMDIEGSELEALKGAITTIKTWKPVLVISVYHKITDFQEIPQYIDSLNLGYKFYFGHHSMHHEESVVFAKV